MGVANPDSCTVVAGTGAVATVVAVTAVMAVTAVKAAAEEALGAAAAEGVDDVGVIIVGMVEIDCLE